MQAHALLQHTVEVGELCQVSKLELAAAGRGGRAVKSVADARATNATLWEMRHAHVHARAVCAEAAQPPQHPCGSHRALGPSSPAAASSASTLACTPGLAAISYRDQEMLCAVVSNLAHV